MWELVLLAEHVHPSVAAMTRALLAGVAIEYAGDPMRDMSTSAFLDKFVQKKPKVNPKPSILRDAEPSTLPWTSLCKRNFLPKKIMYSATPFGPFLDLTGGGSESGEGAVSLRNVYGFCHSVSPTKRCTPCIYTRFVLEGRLELYVCSL